MEVYNHEENSIMLKVIRYVDLKAYVDLKSCIPDNKDYPVWKQFILSWF